MGSQVICGQFVQSQTLRAWKLVFTTSHEAPSPNYGMNAHMATWKWGFGLLLQVGLSKKLDRTLNPSPLSIEHKTINIQLQSYLTIF